MSLLSVLNLPPAPPARGGAAKTSAHKGGEHAHGAKAPVSAESKQFTATVMLQLAQIATLEAKKIPEAAQLRQRIVAAAKAGQKAEGRKAASIQLMTIGMEIVTLQAKAGIAAAKAAEASKAAAAPKEDRYDVNVGGKQLEGATKDQVCVELTQVLGALDAELKRGFEAHCTELQIQQEEPFAAWVSGGIGAIKSGLGGDEQVDIMDLSIWDQPQQHLRDAQSALKRQDVEAVIALVPKIRSGCKRASGKVSKHNADSIDNAQTAVDGLEKVKETSVDVVGDAAEALGGKAVGVAVKGGMAGGLETVQQLSAIHIAKTQKEMNWEAVAREGAAKVASEVVGIILKGALLDRFSSLFGSYLSKAKIGDAELKALQDALGVVGPLNRDALMTGVQKYVRDFLLDKGVGLVTDAVGKLVKNKKESDPPMPIDEMLKETARSIATDQGLKAFFAYVIAKGVKPK